MRPRPERHGRWCRPAWPSRRLACGTFSCRPGSLAARPLAALQAAATNPAEPVILFLAEPGPRSHSVYGKHRLQLEKATDTHSDTGAHPATGAHPHTPEPRRRRRPPTRNPPHNGLPQYCQTHTNPAAQTPPPYRQQRIPPHHYARENLLLQRGLVTQKRTFNPGLRRLATPPAELLHLR
jgi:hypothetical protein